MKVRSRYALRVTHWGDEMKNMKELAKKGKSEDGFVVYGGTFSS